MAEIFVLCVVDGESLVESYPRAKGRQKEDHTWEPIPYPDGRNSRQYLTHADIHPHARMITRQQSVLDHQASDDLAIKAEVGDLIQWRAISITDDRLFKVEIDGFQGLDLMSNLVHHKDADYWEAEVIKPGDDAYWVDFMVLTPSLSKDARDAPHYFFHWDPRIVATPRSA